MSSNASRSASAEPFEEKDRLEASTSQPRSPGTPGSTSLDDTPEDQTPMDTDDTSTPDDNNVEKTPDGTDNAISADTSSGSTTHSHAHGDWQAIWAPVQRAYYFYNSRTNETTWTNPFQFQPHPTAVAGEKTDDELAGTSMSPYPPTYAAQAAAAEAAGIDPSLAYLDPSLGLPGTPGGTFTAKFNARTGAFARMDARDPSHLSEAERAKRMSEVYFDVGAWERDLEQRNGEEEGSMKKRKRPSKKDLERFREQKRLKKIAKTAWLRT